MEGYNFFPCPSDPQFSFERNEEFKQMSDTYPGPGHWRQFVEQTSTQRVLLLPLELSKPAQVVQASTKKIGKEKRK